MGEVIGGRVAAVRSVRRMSQATLAEAAGVSLSLLRKIEQGSRSASPSVLNALAEALATDPERLAGHRTVSDSRVHAAIPAIRRAASTFDLPADGPFRSGPELGVAVHEVITGRLWSRYAHLSTVLPGLLDELTRAVHCLAGREREEAAGQLALAYRAADGVAFKYGYLDLSARLVELMRWAAEQSGDALLEAAAAYVRTEVFFADKNLDPALCALEAAVARIQDVRSPQAAAACGALHMRAAVVAARSGRADHAHDHLREAASFAGHVSEGVYHGTAFGSCSVRIHQVAVAVELGDGEEAVRAASDWAPPADLPAERRSHYYIDLARAQLWTRRWEAAFVSLQHARRAAPQHTREHPYVREIVMRLLRVQRGSSDALIAFATWAHVG